MRIGRTLPPAAAPIGWKSLFSGISAVFSGESERNRFEDELKEYFGKSHCFLVSSGKAALTLILRALKEQHPERDEVLIPAYTCYSVPSAIVRAGLKVKLCDTAADSFDFDFEKLEPLLKSNKLLCVVPTHLFGLPADVKRLQGMIDDPEVTIVEDAAQAMGGEWQGEKLGILADVGFFSLGRGKAFSTVEGGIILTGDNRLAEQLEKQLEDLPDYPLLGVFKLFFYTVVLNVLLHPMLFWIPKGLPFLKLGETVFDPDFEMKKMSLFQAGLSKNWVEKIQLFRRVRQKNIRELIPLLDVKELKQFLEQCNSIPDLIRFPVEMPDEREKEEFLDIANQRGLGVAIAYPSAINGIVELTSMFMGEKYPLAEKRSERLVTLPVHLFVTNQDQVLLVELLSKPNSVEKGECQ